MLRSTLPVHALLLGVALLLARPATADEIEATATHFLEALDQQDYNGAWQALHPEYQKLGPLGQWRANIERLRAELGRNVSRELGFREFTDRLPYLPPDRYLVLRFVSHFEKRESAVQEIVVLKPSGEAGGWGVAGYSVR